MPKRNPHFWLLLLLIASGIVLLLYRDAEGQVILPEDDCLRCAAKALRGDFGKLQEWQRVGYAQFMEHGPTWKRAWCTDYFPDEGFPRGQGTRWSYPVNERCAACNELPGFSFVWSNRFGIRQVLDTGADSNDRHARNGTKHRPSAGHWLDIWVPRAGMFGFTSEVMPVAAVRGRQPAKWKHGGAPKHTWLDY